MKNKYLTYSVLALTTMTILSACVVAPAPAPYYRADVIYPDAPPPPLIAYSPPPPQQYEVVGVPPVPGYFWISGVWIWEGGRHVWHSGHWSAPRPGYRWEPHRWHQAGHEWRMDGGHWVRNH
jgi:hypothetical protein